MFGTRNGQRRARVLGRALTPLAAALTLTMLTACGSDGASDSASAGSSSANEFNVKEDKALNDAVPKEYRDNGVKVAVYNDYAPDEWVEDGKMKGWSVDLARAISAKLGVEFSYTPVGFDVILPGIQNGRFDTGFTSFSPLPERRKVLDFVGQRQDGASYAYASDSEIEVKGADDLCGHVVGALTGSYEVQLLEKIDTDCTKGGKQDVDIQQFKTQSEAVLALTSNRIEIVSAGTTALSYVAQQKGGITVAPWINGVVYNSIGVRKGDPLGQSFVDAIDALIEDGTYMKIMKKFGVDKVGTIDHSVLLTESSSE